MILFSQYGVWLCLLMVGCSRNVIGDSKEADQSISEYITERTCWWNEVCKEEFQPLFRCKCPAWARCRSPGRYYNAFCSITETGYVWHQPTAHFAPPPSE